MPRRKTPRRPEPPVDGRLPPTNHLRIVTVEYGDRPVHARCALEARCVLSDTPASAPRTPPPPLPLPPVPPSPLNEVDAAKYLGFTAAALRHWRHVKRGPVYIRIGRSVRYRVPDLDAWLTAHRVVQDT